MLLIGNHSMFRRKCRHDCVKMISVCVIIEFYNKTAKSELGGGNGMNEWGQSSFKTTCERAFCQSDGLMPKSLSILRQSKMLYGGLEAASGYSSSDTAFSSGAGKRYPAAMPSERCAGQIRTKRRICRPQSGKYRVPEMIAATGG